MPALKSPQDIFGGSPGGGGGARGFAPSAVPGGLGFARPAGFSSPSIPRGVTPANNIAPFSRPGAPVSSARPIAQPPRAQPTAAPETPVGANLKPPSIQFPNLRLPFGLPSPEANPQRQTLPNGTPTHYTPTGKPNPSKTKTPRFYGGQGFVRYLVRVQITTKNIFYRGIYNGQTFSDLHNVSVFIYGPIRGVKLEARDEARNYYLIGTDPQTREAYDVGLVSAGQFPDARFEGTASIQSITRVDGQPDTSGNPLNFDFPDWFNSVQAPPTRAPEVIPDFIPETLPPGIPDPEYPDSPDIPDFIPATLPPGIPDPEYPEPTPEPEPEQPTPAPPPSTEPEPPPPAPAPAPNYPQPTPDAPPAPDIPDSAPDEPSIRPASPQTDVPPGTPFRSPFAPPDIPPGQPLNPTPGTQDPTVAPESPTGDPVENPQILPPSMPDPAPAPGRSPGIAPAIAPAPAPGTLPASTPATTPGTQPATTPGTTPATTPATTPEIAPATTPDTRPGQTPATTPDITPAQSPDTTPAQSPDIAPAQSPTQAPPATQPNTTPATTPSTQPGLPAVPAPAPNTLPSPTPSPTPAPATPPNAQPTTPTQGNDRPPALPGDTVPASPIPPFSPTPLPPVNCPPGCLPAMPSEPCRYQPPKIVAVQVKVFDGCSEVAPKFKMQTVHVLSGTESDAVLKYERLFEIEGEQKCNLPIAAVPEWWQVRPGANRPQLVILYAELKDDSKLGRSRYALTLPHYNKEQAFKPLFPTYKKGQWEGILTLADNSKVIVNAATQAEATSVLNSLKTFINPKQLEGSFSKVGERKGQELLKIRVIPVSARFFSTGQKDTNPDWVKDLRK